MAQFVTQSTATTTTSFLAALFLTSFHIHPTPSLRLFNPGNPSRMLKVQVSSPSPDTNPQHAPTLADLSRNASVISSSSSSSSTSDLTIQTPNPPRPIRTFSSPRRPLRSRSPQSPGTPRGSRPPAYLARELGISEDGQDRHTELRPPPSRPHSRSRNSSVNGRLSASDFEFGRILGEGSYSTVRDAHFPSPFIFSCGAKVMLARNINTGNEYAIKVLDKGHLKRKEKTETALAEKNTLVRLGSGHPGIVRLHSTFQDEWSLCEQFPFTQTDRPSLFTPQSSSSTLRLMENSNPEYLEWGPCPLPVPAITQPK